LQNVVEYAVNMENSLYICMDSIPPKIKSKSRNFIGSNNVTTIQDMEKLLIKDTLKIYGYDSEGKAMAAKALGISLSTLYRKIKGV
jgi:transcriptional regulator with PAS, ATPase and Fis domain